MPDEVAGAPEPVAGAAGADVTVTVLPGGWVGAAVTLGLAGAVGADVTVTVLPGGWVVVAAVTLGLAGAVAVRLGKLPIELLMVPPHPAASNPATNRVTGRESLFAERRMLILPPLCQLPREARGRAGPGRPR